MIGAAILVAVVTAAAPAVAIPIGGALVHAGATLDAAAWTRLTHVSANAVDHDGHAGAYEGVRVGDVLRDSGAPVGDAVRGSAARAYVVVSASDGYSAVFALAELETAEPRCAPLFAQTLDGAPLTAKVGPVQVIAPCDRTHARWVRNATAVTVVVPPAVAP